MDSAPAYEHIDNQHPPNYFNYFEDDNIPPAIEASLTNKNPSQKQKLYFSTSNSIDESTSFPHIQKINQHNEVSTIEVIDPSLTLTINKLHNPSSETQTFQHSTIQISVKNDSSSSSSSSCSSPSSSLTLTSSSSPSSSSSFSSKQSIQKISQSMMVTPSSIDVKESGADLLRPPKLPIIKNKKRMIDDEEKEIFINLKSPNTKIFELTQKMNAMQRKMDFMEEQLRNNQVAPNVQESETKIDGENISNFDEDVESEQNEQNQENHLNMRWIRVVFIWILIVWLFSNFVVLANLFFYFGTDRVFTTQLIEKWKIYQLSAIYILLQICFYLTLLSVSDYYPNQTEAKLIKISALSIGFIVIISNLFAFVPEILSNAVKYANYFVINVLSILIFLFCIFVIFKRMRLNKCVMSILFCDFVIFMQSMHTFRTIQSEKNNLKIETVLRILADSVVIFLSAAFIHSSLVCEHVRFEMFNMRSTEIAIKQRLLINEYKSILFIAYFELFLCLAPISDTITDVWTIWLYFSWDETVFAWIGVFLLFASFRFQCILWLILK